VSERRLLSWSRTERRRHDTGPSLIAIHAVPLQNRLPAMTRRFIDLSIYLENEIASDPPSGAQITYFTHEHTFEQIAPFFPGLKREDLPEGEGWAVEQVRLSTHNGTHLDAPWHFHSTMDAALGQKKPAIAIDEVPLEWCFQPA